MFVIIETTIDDINIANKISDKLLNNKLSSCIQIIDNIQSHYFWKGKKKISKEIKLSIKSDKMLTILNS